MRGEEYFLSFKSFPWFENAKVASVLKVRLLHRRHLHWPDLDIDLELESLTHSEKYPLNYRPFSSGVSDLGSNKAHLKGFGR